MLLAKLIILKFIIKIINTITTKFPILIVKVDKHIKTLNSGEVIDLLHLLYPHITKNNIPIQSTDISFDTYLTSLEKMLLQPQPFINIIIQSYTETNRERYKEFVYCLKQNIKNPYVKMIYDFGAGIQEAGIQEAEAELYKNKYKKS